MQIYQSPKRSDWKALLQRPVMNTTALEGSVKNILQEVKQQGDAAVKKFTQQFDKAAIDTMMVSEEEFNTAQELLDAKLKAAILSAKVNIETFHKTQLTAPEVIETMPGVQCWRKSVGIEKVGLYIPGGTAPLFSTILMLGVPAKLAGCKEIILCSPPDTNGQLNPAILFAAKAVGITNVFKVGGVQAIGAMAYGTETIPAVSKIFGPGNQYVTCAKQLVQQDGLAIDMPAGPSEVAVYADESANAAFVAADLLSQAEHGSDSQVVLVSCSQTVINSIEQEINQQVEALPRKDIALKALANSKLILVNNEAEAIDMLNEYAPEHLIISCNNPMPIAEQIINAGSVFLGHYSPESVGDYASGTNHTLPTNGYAKAYSGVSVDSFVKKITFQRLTREGLQNISKTVIAMAEAEGLQAHANAVKVRL
ncbi:MAG: histidinol dehydrogenase [Niastella sp.]|uniref:histidinol dehydrogenase n=1 Tax=Niastella sp. TaxID=1869183 RepID=UPI00389ADD45